MKLMFSIDLFVVEKKLTLPIFLELQVNLHFYIIKQLIHYGKHQNNTNDAVFFDEIVDGCGFEIIQLSVIKFVVEKYLESF